MTAPTIRLAALALLVALSAAGCGRRGPLEPPGGTGARSQAGAARVAGPAVEGQANAPGQAQVDDSDAERETLAVAPIPAPPRGMGRRGGFTPPTTAFPLDPLL